MESFRDRQKGWQDDQDTAIIYTAVIMVILYCGAHWFFDTWREIGDGYRKAQSSQRAEAAGRDYRLDPDVAEAIR